MTAVVGLVLLLAALGQVRGHGMMVEPVNRATMWRDGYPTPPDYDDNQQFCGGQTVQWEKNGGKCGECGDNWADARPRKHENTGEYGTGIIVRDYKQGQVINVTLKLTANHMGWFNFKLCPLSSPEELETEACFQAHPVRLADGSDDYKIMRPGPGLFDVQLRLPQGLTCDHCVLQWDWETASTWGVCKDGSADMGCGPQEHFLSCSDIAIH